MTVPGRGDLDQVASFVAAARRLLGEGRRVDLSALEGMVRDLCSGIADAPIAEARPLVPELNALLAALELLEADLAARHAASAGQAVKAYGRGVSADKD